MTDATKQPLPADDYDSPWKDALEHHFPEFLAFYFPDAHAGIDWSRGYQFLDKELAQVAKDAELGKRYVDKLVAVHRHNGVEDWGYIHIEIQGGHDSAFAKRMFDLYFVIDWMMYLPPELQDKLWQEINILEQNKTMPYVSSVERIGYQRGRREEEGALVCRLLKRRFGPLPQDLENRIATLPLERIETLIEDQVDFSVLANLDTWLQRH